MVTCCVTGSLITQGPSFSSAAQNGGAVSKQEAEEDGPGQAQQASTQWPIGGVPVSEDTGCPPPPREALTALTVLGGKKHSAVPELGSPPA